MFASLLLPLLVAGATPADPATVVPAPAGVPAAAAVFADPPVRIDLNERVYRPGDRARVRVRTEQDGHLLVFQVDVDGNLRVLFPLNPFDDSFVRGGRRIELDGRGDRETFIVGANEGQGWIYAAYSRLPFQVERYAVGDHWDYARLSPSRLPESPEPELTDLVRDMARASFDYDVIPYAVAGRQVATTVVHRYDPFYYDCFGCGYYGPRYGSSITIRIGAPARYYGSCWDAYWCDPYYYDPFYYRPRYVYYGPRYYRPYYRPPVIYRPRYAGHNRPYFPGFGAGVPYRDRRTDGTPGIRLVSDNTVYAPPPRTAAGGFAETPARRQIEESPGYDLSPASGRRGDVAPAVPGRAATPASPEARTPERSSGSATPARRPAADADRPTTDRRAVEPRTPSSEPRAAEPRTPAADRSPSAEPARRSAEPRSPAAQPRSGTAEPRAGSSEPRSGSSEPRRRDSGPRETGGESSADIEARPSTRARPAPAPSQSPAASSPARTSGSASSARPSQPQPERRSSPQPAARSGGSDRGSGASARPAPAPSRSGGSQPARSSGGGRRGG